jgi:hypothetical protein
VDEIESLKCSRSVLNTSNPDDTMRAVNVLSMNLDMLKTFPTILVIETIKLKGDSDEICVVRADLNAYLEIPIFMHDLMCNIEIVPFGFPAIWHHREPVYSFCLLLRRRKIY